MRSSEAYGNRGLKVSPLLLSLQGSNSPASSRHTKFTHLPFSLLLLYLSSFLLRYFVFFFCFFCISRGCWERRPVCRMFSWYMYRSSTSPMKPLAFCYSPGRAPPFPREGRSHHVVVEVCRFRLLSLIIAKEASDQAWRASSPPPPDFSFRS